MTDTASTGHAASWARTPGLVDEMYRLFQENPEGVSEGWREFFADYRPRSEPTAAGTVTAPHRRRAPLRAAGRHRTAARPPAGNGEGPIVLAGETPEQLRGAAARIVSNMEASLEVPTATSVRAVPAKLLEVNRQILNNHLARAHGGKVSFTHLIGFAVLRALRSVPAMNSSFGVVDGKPSVVHHEHVNLGLAIDMQRPDGTRTLIVPNVKQADTLDFAGFHAAYEDLIRRARAGELTADDLERHDRVDHQPGHDRHDALGAAPHARARA